MTDERSSTILFAGLVSFTLLSVLASRLHFDRTGAIVTALAFAVVKGFLIGWYFMRLKSAGWIARGAVFIGILAVLILSIGIFPDVGLFNR
ncbi:MAG: cytochrome C oxidase subunit IV family protein [Elusimicrobia bacterium]|jgi:caa(3)-type oxidase subunit IV|nr:cytochrome C oxidase subunit IV family protein [Elusimicrobiota bacterium]